MFRDLWESVLYRGWERVSYQGWVHVLYLGWETICSQAKAWSTSALEDLEQRIETAKTYFASEVKRMFEGPYMSRGGRWDLEGLKLDVASGFSSASSMGD